MFYGWAADHINIIISNQRSGRGGGGGGVEDGTERGGAWVRKFGCRIDSEDMKDEQSVCASFLKERRREIQ